MTARQLQKLLADARACTLCQDELLDGVRPVLQAHADARILIAGQAPGRRVHETGVPFDDPSGDRLREWMGVSKQTFYDAKQIAILPMGFCFPGTGKSGDLPPRPECAPAWRGDLLAALGNLRLTLILGQHAMKWHLVAPHRTLTETVREWKSLGPDRLPLPHPSPRNNIWLKKNPWFEAEVLPELQSWVRRALG